MVDTRGRFSKFAREMEKEIFLIILIQKRTTWGYVLCDDITELNARPNYYYIII